MVDDLGWGDTGFNGNPIIKTPNLDQMSKDGVRFTRFYYASAECSLTRSSVLTGRNPFRTLEGNWEARPGPSCKNWDFHSVMPAITNKAVEYTKQQKGDQAVPGQAWFTIYIINMSCKKETGFLSMRSMVSIVKCRIGS